MAFAHPRMSLGLRSTPRGSPAHRSPAVRSPVKTVHEEQYCLSLRNIIGTTTTSSNAFDGLASTRSIAYVAGAAAVLVTFSQDLKTTQRLFRAKPSSSSHPPAQSGYDSPTPGSRTYGARERYPGSARVTNTAIADSFDPPSSRAAALRERTKALTCVCLSPDGRFVATGETGHKPRVLIFPLAREPTSNGPAAAISEHTFGVKCLAFSPDSQYLASLGDINDGFLYIWQINSRTGAATLHANNKCTSSVRHVAWCGNALITVGTRHVKIWRLDQDTSSTPSKRLTDTSFALASPSKALAGRNCLLGPLLDKTYKSVIAVDAKRAIVCSDEGDVCLLDDTSTTPVFRKIADAGFIVNAATIHDGGWLVVGGAKGQLIAYQLADLLSADQSPDFTSRLVRRDGNPKDGPAGAVGLVSMGQELILLGSDRFLTVLIPSLEDEATDIFPAASTFCSHSSAVLGVISTSGSSTSGVAFITFSTDGKILMWDLSGRCLSSLQTPLAQNLDFHDGSPNELKAITYLEKAGLIITGERSGVLQALELPSGNVVFEAKAHATEITQIAVREDNDVTSIATAGRDRSVQIFQRPWDHAFDLAQTLEEHVGAVIGVAFSSDGERMVSCSTDRTMIIHNALTGSLQGRPTIAFVLSRTINLKATPLSMTVISTADQDCLRVATADKMVTQYTIDVGVSITSFKASVDDDGDPVNLNAITQLSNVGGNHFVAGCSSSDKSVRVYDAHGTFIGREYGHTEGLVDIAAINDGTGNVSLVSVSTDSTIFIWDLTTTATHLDDALSGLAVPDSMPKTDGPISATRPPLRRVLSSSELLQFQQASGDDKGPSNTPRVRSRSRKRKPSRQNLRDNPKLESTPPVSYRRRGNNTSDMGSSAQPRTFTASRPSSPASPKHAQRERSKPLPRNLRRQTSQPALSSARRRSIGNGNSNSPTADIGLRDSTQQICRALHTYRRRLIVANDSLPIESVRELEKELSLTIKVLAEKTPARGEVIMEKLLDKYSEKLVSMLDQRVEEKVKDLVATTKGLNIDNADLAETKHDASVSTADGKTT